MQLVARLQRTSLVSAVARDAAHRVAQAEDPQEADDRVRRLLGPDARVTWRTVAGQVQVAIEVDAPSVPGLSSTIRRGATARMEAVR